MKILLSISGLICTFLLNAVSAQPVWTEASDSNLVPGKPIKASQIKEIRDAIGWNVSGSNAYRTSGNVGIGTISPAHKLDVAGNIRTTGRNVYFGTGEQKIYGDNGGTFYMDSNHDTFSVLRLRDKQDENLTALYAYKGTSAGDKSHFGLMDSDNQWAFFNHTDAYSQIRINNIAQMHIDTGSTYLRSQQLQLGWNRSGNRYAYLDLVGDDTYTDYGLRIMRGNGGANSGSEIAHRGTGNFTVGTRDAADLKLLTNWTERLTVKANTGNVGIGTASPAYKLDVAGNIRTTGRNIYFGTGAQRLYGDNSSAYYMESNHDTITQLIMRDKQDTTYGRLYGSGDGVNFGLLDGDGHWGVRIVKDSYVELRDNNEVTFRAGQGGVTGSYGTVQTHGGGKSGYEGYSINGREVFMHDGGANVGIYNDVANRWRIWWDADDMVIRHTNNENILHADQNSYTYLYNNGVWRLRTESNGTRTNGTHQANAFTYVSDKNLKTGIKTISGLETIKKLRGVDFAWKDSGKKSIGLIAQEVEVVLPELVDTDEKGSKSVQYGNLVAPLIEAVKEQQNQIETLEARLEALEK